MQRNICEFAGGRESLQGRFCVFEGEVLECFFDDFAPEKTELRQVRAVSWFF